MVLEPAQSDRHVTERQGQQASVNRARKFPEINVAIKVTFVTMRAMGGSP
jgi:hypothetical protein